jgi:hypothetical protein
MGNGRRGRTSRQMVYRRTLPSCGVTNKQNVRFWARELPHTLHEEENYGAKVNVWTSISTHGIIGPFFFHDTVTKELYKDMLENSLIPLSWQLVSLYTHSGSCRMEPVHTHCKRGS